MAVFLMGGGGATSPENVKALYAFVCSRDKKEQYNIPFVDWKRVGEYWDPVDPTSLSANFAAMFLEVESLINSFVEWSSILNDITQDKNKVLEDEINETVKFLRLERIME